MELTRGKIVGAQKIVVYGPEGIGKSTFASKFPNPVFIDTEGSTKHLDVARTPKPSSWTMLLEQVKYFKANPYKFDTLVVDTADWAEQLCVNHLVAKAPNAKEHGLGGIEGFGYGKGYTYLAEEFGRLLNLLEDVIQVGMNVVITAHAQMRKFEQPDEVGSYDRWELKLQKKTAPLIKEWADMVLFTNYKTYVVNVDGQGAQKGKNKAQGGNRVMYTSHHNCWDAKNRNELASELPFDYSSIAHCIVTRETVQATQNTTVASTLQQTVQQTRVTTPQVEVFKEDTYFYHPESDSYFICKKGEVIPTDTDFQLYNEITKDKYEKGIEKQQTNNNRTTITPKDDLKGIPKALADLMKANDVTVEEIQEAVIFRGYYPKDTPFENYDPGFIAGVLIGAWTQVFDIIKELRVKNDIFTPVGPDEEIPF